MVAGAEKEMEIRPHSKQQTKRLTPRPTPMPRTRRLTFCAPDWKQNGLPSMPSTKRTSRSSAKQSVQISVRLLSSPSARARSPSKTKSEELTMLPRSMRRSPNQRCVRRAHRGEEPWKWRRWRPGTHRYATSCALQKNIQSIWRPHGAPRTAYINLHKKHENSKYYSKNIKRHQNQPIISNLIVCFE